MTRRFEPTRLTVSRVPFRIVEGRKFDGDLRLDVWNDGHWEMVKMEMAFFLVDFFTENEQARRLHEGHWVQNGDRYFLSKCISAVRHGWRWAAAEVERQRERIA